MSRPAGRHAAGAAGQDFQYTVDIQSRLNDPGQFGDIVVKDQTAQGGRLIYLRDVARVELGAQTYSLDFHLESKPAAGIAIYQTPDSNSLQVGKEVKEKMAELSRRFPEGLRYQIPYDTTIFVTDSINEVYTTLYEAGVLVLIVILVFLQNFRAMLVPATTVPVTIIGAFAGMAALGYTVNLSTLFGIVLAIGIVVDDAIVIVEGVTKYIEQGINGHDAAIKAMDDLFGPIIGITLVLMAVFIPAAFVPGLTGNMFAQFALVIAVNALISAVNAATLKPTQCALWLRTPVPPEQRNFFFRGSTASTTRWKRGYARFIGRMVSISGLMVIDRPGHRGRGIWGLARLPTAFIPIDDQGYVMVAVQLPEGASLGRTSAALEQVGKIAHDDSRRRAGIAISGMSVLDNSADLANAGDRLGDAEAVRRAAEGQGRGPSFDLSTRLQKRSPSLPDGQRSCCRRRRSRASATPAASRCSSKCSAAASTITSWRICAQQIVKEGGYDPRLRACDDLPARRAACGPDRRSRTRPDAARLGRRRFRGADRLCGLDLRQPVQQIRPLAAGLCAGRLALPPASPDDLLNLEVRSQDGQMVPIGAMAHLGNAVSPPLITFYNLFPSATIVGGSAKGYKQYYQLKQGYS